MSATVKFYFSDLTKYAFTPSSEDINQGADQLKTYFARDFWQHNNATTVGKLEIDFGSAISRNCIVIENHNLGSLGGNAPPKLEAADDSAFATGLVTVIADLSAAGNPYIAEFAAVTKRYWRIRHASTTGAIAKMKIGQVFIDTFLNFPNSYEFPYRTGNNEYKTSKMISLNGNIRTSQPYPGRKTHEIKFKWNDIAFRQNFQKFFSTVRGILRPFYFLDLDDAIYYVHIDADYMPVDVIRYGVNNVETLILRGQLVSDVTTIPDSTFVWDTGAWDTGIWSE